MNLFKIFDNRVSYEEIKDKIKVNKKFIFSNDYCVLSACDKNIFPCLQFLYYSLICTNKVEFILVDLGMTENQLNWCSDKFKVIKYDFVNESRDYLIFQKPFFLNLVDKRKVLWIDADCIVCNTLEFFSNEENLIFIRDYHNTENSLGPVNDGFLHSCMGTNLTPHQSGPPFLNAGIYCIDKDRDGLFIEEWQNGIKKALRDKDILKHVMFQDQGIAQWLIESKNLLHCIIESRRHNSPDILEFKHRDLCDSPRSFLKYINVTTPIIGHLVGFRKLRTKDNAFLWKNWSEVPLK